MQKYKLWYDKEAPYGNENVKDVWERAQIQDDGWEEWSLPIGNGYMGINVFGRTMTERLQITENSLFNPKDLGGCNNFCELYLDFGHGGVKDYRRELDLDRAVATTQYEYNGVTYKREHFASYPDRVFVTRVTASEKGKVTFAVRPTVPYVGLFVRNAGDNAGKSGTVDSEGDRLVMHGHMHYYNIQFEGQFKIINKGGRLINKDGMLIVEDADEAVLIVAVGTNYHLESRVFTEPDRLKKLAPYENPHRMVSEILDKACEKTYDELYSRHLADYQELFGRVHFELEGDEPDFPTDLVMNEYRKGDVDRYQRRDYFKDKKGDCSRYLETLYFQFGRYLLISSSRKGTLPATLQGVWNRYRFSPFSCGYWHNINVQMNYWPAFITNIPETFEAYADYHKAYLKSAEEHADEYIKYNYPKNYKKGDTGWCIGTPAYPYEVFTVEINKDEVFHSGPATGALTTKLFWEYYDFTRDMKVLRETTYPAISGMARFLSKTVEDHDGKMLVTYSASPEQFEDFTYKRYHPTIGCAFDQQLIWENHNDTLKAAKILGIEDDLTKTLRDQIDKLDPVQIGKSGQIKEYREEEYYGEYGEKTHRHVSQLMGLYPGTCINSSTKEWLDAAKTTLAYRGDKATGWGMAHRLNQWARTKDGDRTYQVLQALLMYGTLTNLWDTHQPYQIDGNLGGTSGIAEMLLQSHEGYIEVIPSIPRAWNTGSYSGLVARGSFVVDCSWSFMKIKTVKITSRVGGECRFKLPKNVDASSAVASVNGRVEDDILIFDTEKGSSYTLNF